MKKNKNEEVNIYTQLTAYTQPLAFIDNDFYQNILNMDFGKPQSKIRKKFHHTMLSLLFFKTNSMRARMTGLILHYELKNDSLKEKMNLPENLKKLHQNYENRYGFKLHSYDNLRNQFSFLYDDDEYLKIMNKDKIDVPILKDSILSKLNFESGIFEDLPFKQNPNLSYCLWFFYIDNMWSIIDHQINPLGFTVQTGKEECDILDIKQENALYKTLEQVMSENIHEYLDDYDSSEFEFIYKKLENLTLDWILNEKINTLLEPAIMNS